MNSNRTAKSIKNVTYNLINQVVSLVLVFATRTLFIKYIGETLLGVNAVLVDTLSVLSIADLGLRNAMIYSFYKPLVDNDTRKLAALVNFYSKIYLAIAGLITILGVAFTPFVHLLINADEPVNNLEVYYLLSLAGIVVSYLCVSRTSLLEADQKNYIVVRSTMVANTIKLILQIIAISLWSSYAVFLLLTVLCNLGINIFASSISKRDYPYIVNKELLEKEEKSSILRACFSAFINKVSYVLLNTTDSILISVIVGTIIVGYYSNYSLIELRMIAVFSAIFSAISPSIGNLIAMEKPDKRYKVFKVELLLVRMINIILIPCYVSLIENFIYLWVGETFLLSKTSLLAITINMFLIVTNLAVGSFYDATGLYIETKWVSLLCSVINIILSIVLGKLWGLTGIILATSISKIATSVWYEGVVLHRKYFDCSSIYYFIGMAKNAAFTLVCSLVLYYGMRLFPVESWIEWTVKAIICVAICGMLDFAIYRKQTEFNEIVERLRKRIKR